MSEKILILIITLLLLTPLGLTIYVGTIDYRGEESLDITVQDKYIKRDKDRDLYLIFADNGETYKISDLLFKGKFNSTDLYNQCEIGERYKITITGKRNHFFSWYKNINKIEKISN